MRGESGRVAERVRDLLSDYSARETGRPGPTRDDGPDPAGPTGPAFRASLWRRLAARVPIRLDPGRRAALAVGLAVLVAAVVTGLWLVAERPRALAVSATDPQIPGAASPIGTAAPTTPVGGVPVASVSAAIVVVDVAGKVHRPGLYRLPAGSRVDDAVRRAGGPLAGVDLSSLNLAAKVVDGQQILVGAPGGGGAGSVAGAPGATPALGGSGTVNLNSATLEQLETLPGIGPVLGQHILDWRTAHGSFSTVDELNEVSGIGVVKYAAVRPLVTI